MEKLACVFLALCMLLCAVYAGAEDSEAPAGKKTFPIYYERGGEEPTDPAFPLYFIGGVDPDVFLTRKDSFYDREQLTDFINSLR